MHQYALPNSFLNAENVEIDVETNLLKTRSDKEALTRSVYKLTSLQSKNNSLIRAALKVAMHTDLFVSAAYVKLKDVLSLPEVSNERLSRMCKTLMKSMLATAATQKIP